MTFGECRLFLTLFDNCRYSGKSFAACNNLVSFSMQIKRYLVFPLILGDAQFVSATYRLFKTPQDDQKEVGTVVTYKGNKI